MKVKLIISSQQLTKEEIQRLLQAIRTCERALFPDKEIYIWVEVPELSKTECREMLASIKPSYGHGVTIIGLPK